MQQLLRFLVLHATLQVHLAPLQAGLLLSVWGAKLGVLAEKNFQSARSLMPKAAVETSIERNGASSASFQLDGVPQSGDDAQAASSVDDLLSTYITSSSDVDTSSSSTIGQISIAMDVMPLEGCSASANIEWIFSKNNKPASGNIASNAIDGKASTRWAAWGRSKWLKAGFSGGEDGDYLVEGVAIAFHNGDRRVAFFDITLLNEADKIVSTRKGLESSGLTDQFQVFELEKPVGGSTIILTLRGTTANAWNSISEISVCLAPIKTPSPVPVPTSPSMESPSGITFVGCFLDDTSGSTRTIDSAHTSMEDLTPLKCARFCAGYKFMGLQYSQECFCGDTYYTEEAPAVATDTCFMPCIGDVETTCGGPWANSVYVVGDPTVANGEVTGIDDGESGQIPRRQFTVVNQCEQMIRVGSTGGFVQAMTDEDGTCPSGSILDSTVKSCFWALPLPEEGKSYDLESGGQLRLVFDHEAINGVRWSGNMWASTGCDKSVGCETATCLRNTGWPDGYCPPSTGPTGPVTKAEFTLVDTGVDYYDVTVIDGVNLPLEMRPDPESNPLERDDDYWCSNPGGPNPMAKGLESCTWDFDPSIQGLGDMSNYLRWVRNDAGFVDCETDSDCVNLEGSEFGVTYKCGALFGQDALNGAQTTEVFPKKCGSTLGWHSAGGICGASEAKPLGYFPNSYPFMCNVRTEQVAKDNSTQADLYSCRGTYYSQSGYSRGAEETACGCPEWLDVGINAPSSSPCESHNPYWNTLSLPWLKYLKKGCPTSYSFPFDDHTSTFVCRNEDLRNTHSGFNSMSYILTFCPASCILTSRR